MSDVKGAAKNAAKAEGKLATEIAKWTAKKAAVLAIAGAVGITGLSLANFTITQLDALIRLGGKAGYHYSAGQVFVDAKTKTQNAQKLKKQWRAFVENQSNKKVPLKHPYGKAALGIAGLAAFKARKKWRKMRK